VLVVIAKTATAKLDIREETVTRTEDFLRRSLGMEKAPYTTEMVTPF